MPNINPRIRSLDDLLGVAREVANTAATEDKPAQTANNGIQMLSPQIIRGFRGHPFRLYEGDRLNDLVESISENGVLVPAIVRKIEPDENGFEYEMLAGHNRQNAASLAHRELPCIVKENLSDQDAWIYVIETNVLQRSFSEMLPSEKAAVLALRYSKMICQGRRNDIIEELKRLENPDEIRENPTSGTQCHRIKSRDVLGAEYNLKGRAVANYLRINELSVALKIRIDDGEFTIAAAVQLSYLEQEEQQMVEAVLSESEYKVNEGKAVLLREYTGKLTPERAEQILSGEFSRKPKKSTAAAFKVKPAIYKKYFTASISQKEFDSIVDEALALYFAQKEAAAV
ncbi:ParB N-terminal domain-containing protein [Flavonifractor plautii]|jgi:ParB family chromosome partitioning protein|uniref:ParB N-terminal domain-containing protein n=1 Tax=Flavonifractor plautii TaxID=292800 RepID=UPI00232F9AD5|nr:ParB N-terminal domain-containing protein [Flavonifractor plautii]MDB7957991.1 ParB N-terminal domain-containing protein [Flavonifractor plautii]